MALVRSASLAGYREKLTLDGINPVDVFNRLGLPSDILDDPDQFINQQAKVDLLECAARMTGKSNWGLELGSTQNLAILGAVGVLVQQSTTVREALHLIGRYIHRQAQHVEFLVIETGNFALLRFRYMDEVARNSKQANDMAIAATYSIVNHLCNQKVRLQAVEFMQPAAEYPDNMQQIFSAKTSFGYQYGGLVFDRKYLDLPVAGASPTIQRMVQTFLQSNYPDDVPGQVCWVLGNMLPREDISLQLVASCMGMSSRTLQRRLLAHGVAFKELLDSVRVNLVCLYLKEGRFNLTHIAQMVGYAHQSALSRSFKRIKGISPSTWEREQRKSLPLVAAF